MLYNPYFDYPIGCLCVCCSLPGIPPSNLCHLRPLLRCYFLQVLASVPRISVAVFSHNTYHPALAFFHLLVNPPRHPAPTSTQCRICIGPGTLQTLSKQMNAQMNKQSNESQLGSQRPRLPVPVPVPCTGLTAGSPLPGAPCHLTN